MTDFAALVAQTDLVALVARYVPLKPRGREHVGLCCFHAEDTPSFTVGEFKNRQRFRCWGCGESGDALDFLCRYLGVEIAEAARLLNGGGELPPVNIATRTLAKPAPRITSKPPLGVPMPDCIRRDGTVPEHIYPYLDAVHELIGVAAQYPDAPEPEYWTWGASPGEPAKWAMKPFSPPRPFYGAERLAKLPEAQVILVESERTVDAGQELFPEFVCLAWPGGRNDVAGADWRALKGRKVVLIPTGDDAGADCMRLAAVALEGYATEVKGVEVDLIPLSGEPDAVQHQAPHGWTLADGLAAGWTSDTALAWAVANRVVYRFSPSGPVAESRRAAVPPPPAPVVPSVSTPPSVPEPRPVQEVPQDAPESPRSDASPALGVVEGNTVRKPRRAVEVEPDLPPEFSEDALAEAFSRACPDWRYCSASGAWYAWEGSRWRLDEKESVFHTCRHVMRAQASRDDGDISREGRKRIASFKMVHAVLRLVGSDPRHATARAEWDADPWLLGTAAGVVDLRLGKVIEASREQLISRSASVAPVAGPTPLFDKVMEHAAKGNADLKAYLMRWLGYLLTGDCREEKFLFLHGAGGSGKSTLVNLAADILGDYAVACAPGMFKEKRHETHPEDVARLAGARMAHASETEEGSRFDESRIKWLTGRDRLSARHMRENSFQFVATHKIVIHGNHRPGLKSVGAEMRRRICLVEWPALPEEERDMALKDNLRAEYPAILARMIAACLEWQDAGLGAPEEVTAATDSYLRAEDVIAAWADDCIIPEVGATALSGEAYRRFQDWTKDQGEHYVMSHRRFSQRLQDRGYALVKRGGGVRMFEGFRLLAPPPATSTYT